MVDIVVVYGGLFLYQGSLCEVHVSDQNKQIALKILSIK